MGFFSWETSDTGESIGNVYSRRPHRKPVYMITKDGRVWKEVAYEGYGEFGGKDIYELIAELNGKGSDRSAGIDLVYEDNRRGDFSQAAARGIELPKLVSNPELLNDFDSVPYPENCKFQGYFYYDEDEEEDWVW